MFAVSPCLCGPSHRKCSNPSGSSRSPSGVRIVNRRLLCDHADPCYRQITRESPYFPERPARGGPHREKQLVVVAARERRRHRIGPALVVPAPHGIRDRQRARVERDAHVRGVRDLPHAVGEPVAQIDAGRRGTVPSEQHSHADARLGTQVLRLARADLKVGPYVGSLYIGTVGADLQVRPCLQRSQPHQRVANRSRHEHVVARARAGARQHAPRSNGADRSHVHDQRSGRTRDVAADQAHAVRCRQRQNAVEHPVDDDHFERVRQHEREQRGARRRAHRRQIAQVHRQRAVPDRVGRHEAPVEMNALDLHVGREDLERAALRFDHRRIVAGSHDDPGGHGKPRCDPFDERALAEIRDGASDRQRWRRTKKLGGELVAPLCRVGRSSEPAKAGGTAVIGRASGFLTTEACTTRDLAAHLGCYVGSDEPPKTITSKAGA